MLTIYCKEEQPSGMDEFDFVSMNAWTAAKPGLLMQMADRRCSTSMKIVIDEVCADNTLYQGAPFVGPRLPEIPV